MRIQGCYLKFLVFKDYHVLLKLHKLDIYVLVLSQGIFIPPIFLIVYYIEVYNIIARLH